jgi:cellulose biosynthesis protein BcsQ
MRSVAVYSPKGGAGKSTFAVNLAHLAAAASARRTLIWDLDAQGASTFLLRAEPGDGHAHKIISRDAEPEEVAVDTPYPNLRLLAADTSLRRLEVQLVEEDARKRVRKILRGLAPHYDRIVIDCPPGMTEISEQVFRAVDLIVIPVQPSQLGVRGYEEAVGHIHGRHRLGPEVVAALSMVDGRRKLHREMLAAHADWPSIPQASAVEQMSLRRAPLAAFAPHHVAADAFRRLWTVVERRLLDLDSQGGHAAAAV